MACNCNTMKNPSRKSALRISGSTPQAISTTPSALSGAIALVDTGCSMEPMSSGARIRTAGLYSVNANVQVNATAAGTVSAQLYLDGVPLPDTLRTVTAAVGLTVIPLETLLCLPGNCCCGHTVQVYIYGEATGTVTLWSMDALRQA